MIDPKKLVAFVQSGMSVYPAISVEPSLPGGLAEEDVEEIREELADDSSETSQVRRKLSCDVGYMEISDDAGGFSCGNCKWATGEGICLHQSVRAPVDPEHGCCNYFQPAAAAVIFPPQATPSPLTAPPYPSTLSTIR